MKLRKADCGHWINADLPPAGIEHDRGPDDYMIYLCAECLQRAKPRIWPLDIDAIERKVVEPVGAARGSDGKFLKSRED